MTKPLKQKQVATPTEKEGEWESEFDLLPTFLKKIHGINGYREENYILIDKSFIRKTLHSKEKELRERVEGMKRIENGDWRVGVDDGDDIDEAIPYNQALEDVLQILDKEIK